MSETTVGEVKKSGFSWDKWYENNKARLAEKKKKRYLEDKEYRDAALKRSSEQRKKVAEVDPEGYVISLSNAADILEVTIWTLREWRRKNYFPEPRQRSGRFWFNESQVHLLFQLRNFFAKNGVRTSEGDKESLEQLVALVYANW